MGMTNAQMVKALAECTPILLKKEKTKDDYRRVKELAHEISAECSRRI